MSDRHDHERPRPPLLLCQHCGGFGDMMQAKAAVLDGIPQTVHTTKPCPWCKDGWRKSTARPF